MGECNSIKHDFHKTPNMYPNLCANISNEQQLRLDKINEIKDYLLTKIRERELICKNLRKYIASLEYFNKSLIFLSLVASSISIASKKSRFIKNQEAKGLLSNLGVTTPLSKVPILGDILF